MSIYLVNADRLHFSAKQLEAMTRLPSCGDLGGITEGVACGTDWLAGPSPLKVGWGVTAGRCGNSWIMCTDGDYINQKAVNVNQGKLNISYKEGDEK